MPASDQQITERINSLLNKTEQPIPHTRRVLAHLEQVEASLKQGIKRKELAEAFELTVQQFAAALSGARHLHRQGGDKRLAANQLPGNSAQNKIRNRPAPSASGNSNESLIKSL